MSGVKKLFKGVCKGTQGCYSWARGFRWLCTVYLHGFIKASQWFDKASVAGND